MKSPRVYTYKTTFEETSHWYWGVHKEKKFGETYLGSPVTHAWMWEFYTPKTQMLEVFPYTGGGWKEANCVEDRLILPDLNNPLCLNESCGTRVSLSVCIENGKKTGPKNSRAMLPYCRDNGRKNVGLMQPYCRENGRKNAEKMNAHPNTVENRKENGRKTAAENNKKNFKPIFCLETGDIYPSVREAARQTNQHQSNISRALRTGWKAGGYHWEFVQ